jgi:hypothetical protein
MKAIEFRFAYYATMSLHELVYRLPKPGIQLSHLS